MMTRRLPMKIDDIIEECGRYKIHSNPSLKSEAVDKIFTLATELKEEMGEQSFRDIVRKSLTSLFKDLDSKLEIDCGCRRIWQDSWKGTDTYADDILKQLLKGGDV
jgi:hypothetical protein